MKTYEDLRAEGRSPSEAIEIIDRFPNDYKNTMIENNIRFLYEAFPIPDVVLNNYDFLEDELFLL